MPEKSSSVPREKTAAIIADLKERMRELDQLGEKIRGEGIPRGPRETMPTPRQTMQLLEEIRVPPLRLLKETK